MAKRTEEEILRDLVDKQSALIRAFRRFTGSLPTYIGDLVPEYHSLSEDIDALFQEMSIACDKCQSCGKTTDGHYHKCSNDSSETCFG